MYFLYGSATETIAQSFSWLKLIITFQNCQSDILVHLPNLKEYVQLKISIKNNLKNAESIENTGGLGNNKFMFLMIHNAIYTKETKNFV